MQKETIVISVGGSLISPDSVDTEFLAKFKKIIQAHARRGSRFLIITGGGATARRYQNAARALKSLGREDLDWLGIHATRLNGHLLGTIFRKISDPLLITDPTKLHKTKKAVLIAAGWRPGWSTDYVATILAKKLGSSKLVNLSNVDYVYTKNPRTHKDAKKLPRLTWKEFRKLLPARWDPGIHAPFDPVASKEAEKAKLEVAVINGDRLEEFEKYLSGKKFIGTIIR